MVTIKDVAQGMPEKEEYYYRMAEQNKVDGIICVTYQDVEPYVSEISLLSLWTDIFTKK